MLPTIPAPHCMLLMFVFLRENTHAVDKSAGYFRGRSSYLAGFSVRIKASGSIYGWLANYRAKLRA